jgi:hypothetical protein
MSVSFVVQTLRFPGTQRLAKLLTQGDALRDKTLTRHYGGGKLRLNTDMIDRPAYHLRIAAARHHLLWWASFTPGRYPLSHAPMGAIAPGSLSFRKKKRRYKKLLRLAFRTFSKAFVSDSAEPGGKTEMTTDGRTKDIVDRAMKKLDIEILAAQLAVVKALADRVHSFSNDRCDVLNSIADMYESRAEDFKEFGMDAEAELVLYVTKALRSHIDTDHGAHPMLCVSAKLDLMHNVMKRFTERLSKQPPA